MDTSNTETYGLGDPLMLEKIDKMFACGVGELVDLPQIVVVGDQSSGKSSVLEGLIKKPLPRDSGLCTRFATQIIFKRSKDEGVTVSIIAGGDASPEDRQQVEAWRKTSVTALDSETFADILREVMGLRTSSGESGPTFSNNILRLEITGPDQEHLSVIDVPGIFRNPTPGLTTKQDIDFVKNMVLEYMENPRSVMLTVIPANVDVATQEILELAAEVDPDGDRTLGVLTKPDLVDRGGEPRVIDLIEGRVKPMKLGWHVVRNPGQQDLLDGTLDRQNLELSFFRGVSPWKTLSSEQAGIESLRVRLREVLSMLVTREFPKVKTEVGRKLKEAQKSLKHLGPERSTPHMQRVYLTQLATQFQRLVGLSLDAKHGSDELFDQSPSLKLANAIRARYVRFAEDMADCGLFYLFSTDEDKASDSDAEGNTLKVRQIEEKYPSIEDNLHCQEILSAPMEGDINEWLREVYEESRGFELGTFGPWILATAMKKQSSKWVSISLGYISDVVTIVHRFITTALDSICSDHEVKSKLTDSIVDGLSARYKKAIDQVRFLLDVERCGTLMTANRHFNDNRQKCKQHRVTEAVEALSVKDSEYGEVVRLSDTKRINSTSNTEQDVQELHDILLSYYTVALRRFVDSIFNQATDYFLVSGPETPLNLLSPTFVNNLTLGELEHIAGEAPKLRRLRARLNKEILSLEEAKKILVRGQLSDQRCSRLVLDFLQSMCHRYCETIVDVEKFSHNIARRLGVTSPEELRLKE